MERVRADASDEASFGVKIFDQTVQIISAKRGVADAWDGTARGIAAAAPVAGQTSRLVSGRA